MIYTFLSRVSVQIVICIYMIIQSDIWYIQVGIFIMLLLLLMSNIQLYRRETINDRFTKYFLIRELLIIIPIFPFVAYAPYYIFFIIMFITSILMLTKTKELIVFSLSFITLPILHGVYLGELNGQRVMSFGLLILFFSFFAYAVRQSNDQQEQLRTLNVQLKEFAQKEQELAVVKERVRIARDIHDTVAHKATGLIIQLQKLKHMHRQQDLVETENIITESLEVTRSMLDEMRQSVRSMASPNDIELSGLNVFTRLMTDFQKTTSVHIQSQGLELLEYLSPALKTLVFRILQESFTNAKRHGLATKIDVQCSEVDEHTLEISISDNGQGLESQQQYGFGLTNMQARLHEIGGSISIANQNPHGCKLTLLIPKRKEHMHD